MIYLTASAAFWLVPICFAAAGKKLGIASLTVLILVGGMLLWSIRDVQANIVPPPMPEDHCTTAGRTVWECNIMHFLALSNIALGVIAFYLAVAICCIHRMIIAAVSSIVRNDEGSGALARRPRIGFWLFRQSKKLS